MLITLYKLQKLEAEQAALLSAQKSSSEYRLVRELKQSFERQKRELLQLQEQITAWRQAAEQISRETAKMQDKLNQERAAIYDGSIANIRELNARQTQITVLEEKNSGFTEELAGLQTRIQQGLRQAKQLQQSLTGQYQQLGEHYHTYETLRQGWQQQLSALDADKQALLAQIDEQEISWYEQQKPLFAGLPVARLDLNHVCDGCRTMVTPILYKRTVQGDRTRCEKCGRYLFVE